MAQPTAYTRLYNFTQWSTDYPTTPHAGLRIDAELNAVKHTLDDVLRNLAIIQRDDTQLANNTVGAQQLKPELLLATQLPTDWVTGTTYARLDIVYQANVLYICNTAHTAGVFATDLAASKWTSILDYTDPLGRALAAATAAETYSSAASASATTATTQAGIATAQAAAAAASAVLAASYLSSITFPIPIAQGGHGGSTAAQARANLDVQQQWPALDSLGVLVTAADKGIYTTALDTYATFDLKAVGRTLLAQTTQAAMRSTGLGATTVGDAVFIAANAVAAQTAIGVIDSTLVHISGTETITGAKTFDTNYVSVRVAGGSNAGLRLRTTAEIKYDIGYNDTDGSFFVNRFSGGTYASTPLSVTSGGVLQSGGSTVYHASNLPGTAINWTAIQLFGANGSGPKAASPTWSFFKADGTREAYLQHVDGGVFNIANEVSGQNINLITAGAGVVQANGNLLYHAANLPGTAITWTAANQRINVGDGQTALLINGLTKGVRFTTSSGQVAIEGVDQTGSGSYQNLNIGGLNVVFTISGTNVAYVDSSGLRTAAAVPYNIAGKQAIPVPASAFTPRTTNGPGTTLVESTTNRVMYSSIDFDGTTQEFAQFTMAMPKGWNEGTFTYQVLWKCPAGAAGSVVFGMRAVAVSDGDAFDAAFGTNVQVTDTFISTTATHISPESAAVTIAGTPAENDLVVFELNRVPADAADTVAADAQVIGIRLFITTNAANDA